MPEDFLRYHYSTIMDTVQYCIDVHHLLLRFNVPTFVRCNVNSIVINRRVVMSTYIDQPFRQPSTSWFVSLQQRYQLFSITYIIFAAIHTTMMIQMMIMMIMIMTIIVVLMVICVLTMGTVPFLDISPPPALLQLPNRLQCMWSLPRLTLWS